KGRPPDPAIRTDGSSAFWRGKESLSVSRVLYFPAGAPHPSRKTTIIFLGRCIAARLKRPTQRTPGQGRALRKAPCVLLGLAPDGVYQGISRQMPSWSLTPRFHPCLCRGRPRPSAVRFCGTILQLALTGRYPASCPAEPGLSSRDVSIAGDCPTNFPRSIKQYTRESARPARRVVSIPERVRRTGTGPCRFPKRRQPWRSRHPSACRQAGRPRRA